MAGGAWLGYCPDMPGIVIVGAGFGGIGMGIALKKAGYHDFVILDKAPDLGGTWRDNQYPGCACDVPSPLYSYSFELNPDWSRLFAPQQEIWDYLRNCARKYRLDEHITYGAAVERMDWDDRARRWNVETVQDGELRSYRARAVVSAAGALHLPSYPDIPGAGGFGGTAFHSARWDRSCDAGRPAGRGDRDRGVGDPVRARGGQAGRAPDGVPAHAAVDPARGPTWRSRARLRAAFRKVPLTARALRDADLPGPGGPGGGLHHQPEADGAAGSGGPHAPGQAGHRPGAAGQAHPGLHDRLQADPAVLGLLSRRCSGRTSTWSPTTSPRSPSTAWSPATARARRRRDRLRHRVQGGRVRRPAATSPAGTAASSGRLGERHGGLPGRHRGRLPEPLPAPRAPTPGWGTPRWCS